MLFVFMLLFSSGSAVDVAALPFLSFEADMLMSSQWMVVDCIV